MTFNQVVRGSSPRWLTFEGGLLFALLLWQGRVFTGFTDVLNYYVCYVKEEFLPYLTDVLNYYVCIDESLRQYKLIAKLVYNDLATLRKEKLWKKTKWGLCPLINLL